MNIIELTFVDLADHILHLNDVLVQGLFLWIIWDEVLFKSHGSTVQIDDQG
jgi:hypothetical protein